MAAPRPLTFDVVLGDGCIHGRARNDADVRIVMRDSAGDLNGRGTAQMQDRGYGYFCDFAADVKAGHSIRGRVVQAGRVRIFTVPQLTLRLDRDSDVASGKGPANETLELNLWEYTLGEYDVNEDVETDGTGAYEFDSGGDPEIVGTTEALLTWRDGGDSVRRYARAPHVSVAFKRSAFYGSIRPGGLAAITLEDGSAAVLAGGYGVGQSWRSGYFEGEFYDNEDDEYLVQGGEWVSALAITSDRWRIPVVDGAVNLHGRGQREMLPVLAIRRPGVRPELRRRRIPRGNGHANGALQREPGIPDRCKEGSPGLDHLLLPRRRRGDPPVRRGVAKRSVVPLAGRAY